jgi:Rrf2 family protein
MFSMKAKYAVKAMVALARRGNDGPFLIAELARQEGIPRKFLETILLELKNRGLLHSRKGRGGGYHLACDAATVHVGRIIESIDGIYRWPSCVVGSSVRTCQSCVECPTCGLSLVMGELRDAIMGCLNSMTLADLVQKTETQDGQAVTRDGFEI